MWRYPLRGRHASPGTAFRTTLALVLLLPACVAEIPADGAPGDTVFQAPGLRIYRGLDRHGGPTLVLTNLDEEGGFLSGRDETPGGGVPAVGSPHDSAANPPADQASAAAPAPVTITVREGDGTERPAGTGDIDVATDAAGGTTIVININNLPPPRAEVPNPTFVYPVVAIGGLPGPFRYPDRQPFLGYGLGIRSPSWFGGLGLNAGNRFGLKTGVACELGFDCMFAPQTLHP